MKKRVLILGIDGYIGYPLALHLLDNGYQVAGLDNYSRRIRVTDVGSDSLTPIISMSQRTIVLESYTNFIGTAFYDLHQDPFYVRRMLEDIKPDCIVHLAEMPSASWSMQSAHFCNETQQENVLSTLNILWAMKEVCPDAHLLKLGTMGEYGTPNCDIPEGKIPQACLGDIDPMNSTRSCPMQGLPFPKTPGSFYHLTKVHDTNNIIFACRNWGLSSTDIMQGVLFGLMDQSQSRITRFDYDEHFGTCINRFCAQAISGHPLTIYGKGGQTRGYLPLKDSIQCLNIAIDNPPKQGEYRVLNQFESLYSINRLAVLVSDAADSQGIHVTLNHIENPRKEAEIHYYNPDHQKLFDLGYVPTTDIQSELNDLIKALLPYKDRVIKEMFMPKTKWKR